MGADRIVGYTYQAENLCPTCAADALGWDGVCNPHAYIDKQGRANGIDVDDERSFDSEQWPKVIFEGQVEDDEHCSRCDKSLVD